MTIEELEKQIADANFKWSEHRRNITEIVKVYQNTCGDRKMAWSMYGDADDAHRDAVSGLRASLDELLASIRRM